ncbi:MAG: N-6 DNA methylase [Hungatella sp.]|nr:N-6 DNA methylase [Hungatella sp.]
MCFGRLGGFIAKCKNGETIRWKYGVLLVGNANFAWLQHMLHHLSPAGGVCGTVLANGSLSSNTSNEGKSSTKAGAREIPRVHLSGYRRRSGRN